MTDFTTNILKALKDAGKDFEDHSIFSPSGSAMWANCSGSLIPNLFAEDTAGEEAAEGTVAHGVAEEWLKTGEEPRHRIGTTVIEDGYEIEVTASMLEYVGQYVDWCLYLPGNQFVETRVDFSDLTPLKRQYGTADFAVCTPGKLIIRDLKYGKGIQVYATENTQGVMYAYGFFVKYDWLFDFQQITIGIGQPRLNHFDEWTISREELLERAAWIKERAFAAWCNGADRTPSKKACQWCKVAKDCAAYAVFCERVIDGVFDDLDSPITADHMTDLGKRIDDGELNLKPVDVGSLTVAQKAVILPYRKMVENWFKDIADDLERRALDGEDVPGHKVVEGKSNRVFSNIDDATDYMVSLGVPYDTVRPRGMIGITAAEDAIVKLGYKRKELPKLLNPVVRKPAGKPTMVPESDPRPAISKLNPFDNLDEEL